KQVVVNGVHLCKQTVFDAVVDVECFINELLISKAKDRQIYPKPPDCCSLKLCRNNSTIENIENPPFPSLVKAFFFAGIMHIVSLAEGTKELLFRFNFSSHTSILHVMYDHHGIQPNLKRLCCIHLSPDVCKRRVPQLQSFIRYYRLDEVSLVDKACCCEL
ncbi:hypothetical protein MXB_1294, partial [Myxobolus squamalis]